MRKICFRIFAIAVLILITTPHYLQAETKKNIKEKKKENKTEKILKAHQLLKQYSIRDLQLSRDNARLAMVVAEPVSGTKRKQDIWLYELTTDTFRRITNVGGSDRRPRWSPDGKRLAFLSRRGKEKTQIYLLPMNGGESICLTDGKRSIRSFEWSPDGKFILFSSSQPQTKEEKKKKKEKDDARLVSKDRKSTHLHLIDVKSKKVRALLKEKELSAGQYVWVPNGKKIIFSGSLTFKPEWFTDKIYSLDVESGKHKLLLKPDGPFGNLQVSPDSKTLSFVGSDQDGPIAHDLYQLPLGGGTPRNITGKTLDRSISSYYLQKDNSIIALIGDGFGGRLVHIKDNGNIKDYRLMKDKSIGAFVLAGKKLIYTGYDAVSPVELYVAEKKGDKERIHKISDFHTGYPKLIRPEIFTYKAKDGLTIEAALYKPVKPVTKKLPLITLIHGGPAGRFTYRIERWSQMLADRGFAVFAPNIRGSTGYGIDFVRTIRKDWGGKDWQDVMDGIDYLVARGIADADKLGIGGWSYGGYMSAWAVTQTNRFKASFVGAAMTDLAVEYGSEIASINAYDTWYLGNPYENLDDFQRMSPMTFIKKVRTPCLIVIGENDPIDPLAQSQMFYRGLRHLGVETELVIYPREGHGPREEKHRLDMTIRPVEFFEKYVMGKKEVQKEKK